MKVLGIDEPDGRRSLVVVHDDPALPGGLGARPAGAGWEVGRADDAPGWLRGELIRGLPQPAQDLG